MKTAKFYGKTYEVKPTGNKTHKSAKSFTDFNGYETDRPSSTTHQMGMYDDNGNKFATISNDGKVRDGNTVLGSASIKES